MLSFSIVASIMVRLLVVVLSPHVVMEGDHLLSHLWAHLLQTPLQERLDAPVVVGGQLKGSFAGLLHPLGGIELRESDET